MKLKIFITVFLLIGIALAVYSRLSKNAFAPAEYLPREALVYVQVADLPQFIKIWKESKFKEKYQKSENFTDFQNRHLGRKLLSRWSEFDTAAGFPFDLETLSGLSENQAAVAIYDIGKLEFVFIAPMNEQVFTVTKLMQNQDKFETEILADETVIYRANVEADRGRQKQELIFTHLKGHFVLATSEKLLVQTLDNFKAKSHKNRLSDEPLFAALRDKIKPHTATVWVNQRALNEDYYFKKYWLMSDAKDLKNIRAGIFDFEIQAEKLIEHRKFLLTDAPNISSIKPAQAKQILSLVPDKIPFYRLQTATDKTLDEAIRKTIFEKQEETVKTNSKRGYDYFEMDYADSDWHDYEYLGNDFDENIDEIEDDKTPKPKTEKTDFSQLLQSVNPTAVVYFAAPEVLPAPMFIEFKRGAIFQLNSPQNFNRTNFESEIEKNLTAQVTISAPETKLNWETKDENNQTWRELKLPMLGWNVSYSMRGNKLIVSNNSEFFKEILANRKTQKVEETTDNFNELAVLNLGEREEAFDRVFAEFSRKNIADEFFTKNVGSLLDSISEVKRIELRRNFAGNLLEENVTAILKESENLPD
jgi:hypothetical protein